MMCKSVHQWQYFCPKVTLCDQISKVAVPDVWLLTVKRRYRAARAGKKCDTKIQQIQRSKKDKRYIICGNEKLQSNQKDFFYTPIWWANLNFKVYFKYRFTKCDVKNKEYQNWCDWHLVRHFVKKFSISRSWRRRWRFFLVSVWWGWRIISGWMSEKW